MKKMLIGIMFLMMALVSACAKTPPPEISVMVQATEPPASPINQESSVPVSTPVIQTEVPASPTPTQYVPVDAAVLFDAMRLRSGPGYNFSTLELYPIDTIVSVLGRAPGDTWLFVQTPDDLAGWMMVDGLDLELSLFDIPLLSPENVQVIRGHVYTTNGNPASELTVMANLDSDQRAEHQDVAFTDIMGQRYIYLPVDFSGEWRIEVNG